MATQNTAMDNAALIKEVNEAHKHKKIFRGLPCTDRCGCHRYP